MEVIFGNEELILFPADVSNPIRAPGEVDTPKKLYREWNHSIVDGFLPVFVPDGSLGFFEQKVNGVKQIFYCNPAKKLFRVKQIVEYD